MSRYIPNDTEETKDRLKKEIQIRNVADLFCDIPKKIRLDKPLSLPKPLSEVEVRREVETILKKNRTFKDSISFLGAGIWPHYVPAVVDEISTRTEFLTSYTPYQPETSQGLLQALFEYQSMICELVDMDVANCSMYDWASSLGEAARMASRVTKRNEFLVPHYISPERANVLRTYAEPADIRVIEIEQNLRDGQIKLEDLKRKVSRNTAGVYIENQSYLGFLISSVEPIAEIVHDAGGLFVVGVDPISLGLLRPPGDYGADVVIGEGQPLGNYMSGGGPLLGIFACRDDISLVRQLPGRIIGMTTTQDGNKRAFCMALQTREQHIRRHKATSNICTNESMCALRAAVYMTILGPKGLKELGEIILFNTHYAIEKLSKIDGLAVPFFEASHFKEFTVPLERAPKSGKEANKELLKRKVIGGKPLEHEFPELGQTYLYCVTELHTTEEIENLSKSLKQIMEG
jgi:glycine dehydrogenase subunit 1